ncbi:MAG: hypothetical protein U9O50_09430 [Acidobacteriota bacterium]|nr:hypothetical protein [Acidobacteriota bacterium]
MWRKITTTLLVLIMLMVSFNCKGKKQVKGINLDVSFSEEKLSDNLITDLQFAWKPDHDFVKMSQDYKIYVHFWHKDNLILQDDHFPQVQTSKWEPGKECIYSRRIYIPAFIDEFDPNFKGEETLKLEVGFYSPYDRTGETMQEVLSKKIKVFPPPLDTPEIIYEEGWYGLEENPEAPLKQWRWTAKEARCIIDNPYRDALLVIKGGVNLGVLKDQKVIFKINELILDEFIAEEETFEKYYNIKKEMLGEEDEFILTITTDKTFIPAETMPNSTDERELGIQISFIYFR